MMSAMNHESQCPSGSVASPLVPLRRAYRSPEAHWVCLMAALRAGEPSGNTDDLGDFIRTRPPRGKGAQRA